MKASWEIKKLGEVCEILDRLRKPITKRNRVSGPYPYYGATGILDHVEGYLFDEMLVLLGEDGAKWEPGAKSAFSIDGKTWVNNHAHVMRPNREILNDNWLIYFLNFSDLMPYVSGMTVPKLNQGSLREIQIPLPPLDEQKRIVSILDEAFEGLDRARENAEVNLKSARELFDATLESAFDPYGDTEWEVKALGSVCEIAPKKALVKKILTDEQLVSFVPMNHLGILRRHFTAKEDRPLSSVYKGYTYFCDDDVIIAKITPCFENGKMGLASGMTNGVGFGSSEFVPIRGQGKTLPTYLFYFLLRNNFRENGARVMTGAVGHKRVPVEYIENLPIPLPPLEEQKRISFRLDKASSQHNSLKEKYTTKLQDISDLRQSLLQKAFAGELI